jgi:tRNA threonylcarbamoyladenosine modification (KEOPS) complex  Pcc1 subunit
MKNAKKRINLFFLTYFKAIVVLMVLAIIFFGVWRFLIPQYKESLASIKEFGQSEKEKYDERRKDLEDLRAALNTYNRISARDIERVNSILPREYEKESLFTYIKHFTEKNNLELESVYISKSGGGSNERSKAEQSEKKERKNKSVEQVDITINLLSSATDYSSLKSLIDTFERNLRLMDVKSFSFDSGILSGVGDIIRKEGEQGKAQKPFSFTVSTYYLR